MASRRQQQRDAWARERGYSSYYYYRKAVDQARGTAPAGKYRAGQMRITEARRRGAYVERPRDVQLPPPSGFEPPAAEPGELRRVEYSSNPFAAEGRASHQTGGRFDNYDLALDWAESELAADLGSDFEGMVAIYEDDEGWHVEVANDS